MSPETSFAQATAHFDDAIEYLTFDQYGWAFEETWRGVAWALNALRPVPEASPALAPRGAVPAPGTLRAAMPSTRVPSEVQRVVDGLESLRASWGESPSADQVQAASEAIVAAVFDAWALHDATAEALGLVDAGPLAGQGGGPASMPGTATVSPSFEADASAHESVVVGAREWRIPRRAALRLLAAGTLFPLAACARPTAEPATQSATAATEGSGAAPAPAAAVAPAGIRAVTSIEDMQWPTTDPFLFCAYHVDDYPAGNEQMGPAASLAGRDIGRDFAGIDNWRMYHGDVIPGFPRHPHRGFETVTVVRTGLLDHADSMGAAARYGGGDVQWLTAGGGIQHAEMFPLMRADAGNPLELFQIWLNLPARDKMVPAYFTMLWHEQIPRITVRDAADRVVELTIAAGSWEGQRPPSPPPNSWGSRPESDLAIWTLRMEAGAEFELPACVAGTERSLYIHRGNGAQVGDRTIANRQRVELDGHGPVQLTAGDTEVEILLLQGRPIGEPVARRGPFVMNTSDEIRQAYADFQQTQFGGWPWPSDGPVSERTRGRFARHIDGRYEEPT